MFIIEGEVTKPYKRLDSRIKGILTRGVEFPNEKWARIYRENYLKKKKKVNPDNPV